MRYELQRYSIGDLEHAKVIDTFNGGRIVRGGSSVEHAQSEADALNTLHAEASVMFSTRSFERAYNRKPRGVGNWAFIERGKEDRDDYLDFIFWHNGSFTDARIAAKKHFGALNVRNVVVLS